MREPVRHLRERGFKMVVYLDDLLFVSDSFEEAKAQIQQARAFFQSLGFLINRKKSVFKPTQRLDYLGFTIDTQKMALSMPARKLRAVRHEARQLSRLQSITPRQMARFVGRTMAAAPAITPARLRVRSLQQWTSKWTRRRRDRWDKPQALSETELLDLRWWCSAVNQWNGRWMLQPPADLTLTTDASKRVYGGFLTKNGETIARASGRFLSHLVRHSINVKELLAISFLIRRLLADQSDITVEVISDNSTAVACIRNFGSRVPALNKIARHLWLWCLKRRIFLTATHLPGHLNVEADALSRINSFSWQLHPEVFQQVCERTRVPSIDLFASKEDHLLPRFFSRFPCPQAEATDALRAPWPKGEIWWAHPPPILIGRVLEKLRRSQGTLLLLTPLWPSAPWFPLLRDHCLEPPLLLPRMPNLFRDPAALLHPWLVYPWRAVVWTLSNKASRNRVWDPAPQKQSWHLSSGVKSNTSSPGEGGSSSVRRVESRQGLLTLRHWQPSLFPSARERLG